MPSMLTRQISAGELGTTALNVLQLNDGQKVQDDLHDIRSVLELLRTSQVSQEVRDWLKAPHATTNHHDACAKRHVTSGL